MENSRLERLPAKIALIAISVAVIFLSISCIKISQNSPRERLFFICSAIFLVPLFSWFALGCVPSLFGNIFSRRLSGQESNILIMESKGILTGWIFSLILFGSTLPIIYHYGMNGLSVRYIIFSSLSLLSFVQFTWYMYISEGLGKSIFSVSENAISLVGAKKYDLIPGTARLIRGSRFSAFPSCKIYGEWEIGKTTIFGKSVKEKKLFTLNVGVVLYGSVDISVFEEIIESGNLLE